MNSRTAIQRSPGMVGITLSLVALAIMFSSTGRVGALLSGYALGAATVLIGIEVIR